MYDIDMVAEAYFEGRECRDPNREDVTSRDEVIACFTRQANHLIKYYGTPTSDEEFKFFIELIQMYMYSANYDYTVITNEEWVAIARDILAKAN